MAGPMAVPESSTGTVPDHWAVQPMPTMSPGATPLSARACRAEATMASHQAWGDCSAPPSSVSSIPTAWKAWARIRPVGARTATFGPPVPRSTARTCGLADSMRRMSVALAARREAAGTAMARKRTERGRPVPGPASDAPSTRRGRSLGQGSLGLDLDHDLVAHHDTAVEQRVVEADAEVAAVDGGGGREGDHGLALLHGGAFSEELEIEVDRLRDAPDGQVGGQHPVGVVD